MVACPRFMIAGTGSGVGKTSLTLGLVAALKRRGLAVQTFKVGPDFLDPTWLAMASGRPCYNLDGWMCGEAYVRRLFSEKCRDADIAIIEGVMGLFDGADPATSEGSSAEIARWLATPVLLTVNAHGVARTLAATVAGFCSFEPDVQIAGIIANQTGSDRHAEWLTAALQAADLPPLAGAVPRNSLPRLPSRHLGLVTAGGETCTPQLLLELADQVERSLQLDTLLGLAAAAPEMQRAPIVRPDRSPSSVRIGVAEDAAFHFYYPDNLEALEAHGAELMRFSPLTDSALPPDLDGIYLGGGYPEAHAAQLAANVQMLAALRSFTASGRPLYAECGGLMYLSSGIELLDGSRHAMAGILPFWTRMLPKRKALGYVEVTQAQATLLGAAGQTLRGHEFHYSELIEEPVATEARPYLVRKRRVAQTIQDGYQQGNLLASYLHLQFAAHPECAAAFVQTCRRLP
ncbi:cobyrinate a,c-diamide synthase [Trichlorobacter lovleyi]|uniref:cobyrinate a,c-diamide synthase n=1 Tax=Trichlorobacter lovleyi TaxID=313985 RepID=UPI0023EFEA49|nr:cobyrinate a,c-diamide synthase [Trichlorobacter lovleyi]